MIFRERMTSGDDLPGTRLFDTLNDERNSIPLMEENIKDILVKLGLALLIGTVIGAEREFKNKSAGLRTLILICLGSALFTMISGTLLTMFSFFTRRSFSS